MIMLGELQPGAPLLELEIASQFGCSQGSVREALLALQQEGLVHRQPHRGTRVSECTEAEAKEMFRLRHAIETRAIARGFPRITPALLEELRQLVRQMEALARQGDEYGLSELDRQFHRRLFAAADLPALEPILHRCLVHNQRFKITRSGAARDLNNTAGRHWTIIETIARGDVNAAVQAIGRHVATIVDPGPDIFPETESEAPERPRRSMARPSKEMQFVLDRLAEEDAGLPDPLTLAAVDGRALAEQRNRRWQVEQPAMDASLNGLVPARAGLDTPDVPIVVHRPINAKPGAILFVHGGGFAFCSNRTHERSMRVLAEATGRAVVGADYRLAPEHPFPAGLHDVVAVWRAILQTPETYGIALGPMIIAGDSAGANLALAAVLHERAAGRVAPAGCLLFYGTYAADFDTPSYRDFAEGFGLTTAAMRRYWDWYLADPKQCTDPLAAPLHASDAALAALPSLYLLAAEVDPLASDTYALKSRLDAIGRSDTMRIVPGVVHGFLQMTPRLSAARSAFLEAAEAANRFMEDI
jgi:acetyl esterase/lipase/DNA-binding GntR family transcriptional regulator